MNVRRGRSVMQCAFATALDGRQADLNALHIRKVVCAVGDSGGFFLGVRRNARAVTVINRIFK